MAQHDMMRAGPVFGGGREYPVLSASCKAANTSLAQFIPRAAHIIVYLQFYDIPVVSLRSAVWRNLAAGIEGFQVAGWGWGADGQICDGLVVGPSMP